MKIVQVVADGARGGGTVMVLSLLRATLERGRAAGLVTDRGSYLSRTALAIGAEVEEVDFFAPWRASGQLRTALGRMGGDLVHLHGSRAAFHARALALDRCHYTVHGYHFEHRSPLRRLVGRWAERLATGRRDSVVHVCDYDQRLASTHRLVRSGTSRVVLNGVDTKLVPVAKSAPHRALFVGRLVPQKDPALIAEIASELARRSIPSLIMGGGPGEPAMRESLGGLIGEGRVELTGAVDRERVLQELAQGGVLVIPSRWEGLPVAVLEAMAAGLPVVAAEVGGIPEAVEPGLTGLLVGDRSARSYADAVESLIGESTLGKNLVSNARARVEKQFTLEGCMQRYFELYQL